MTRLFIAIILFFWTTPSFGQQKENEFYTSLQNKIKEAEIKMDSITSIKLMKGCSGGTIVFKPQTKDTTLTFYVGETLKTLADKSTKISAEINNTNLLCKPELY